MQASNGYGRWKTIGLEATPEDMDALQSQMTTSEMNIAMLWSTLGTICASKFNEQLDMISELWMRSGKYIPKED